MQTMATQKEQSPAMAFLVDQLTKNKKASYADLKAKADEKKLKLFPIMFGRAQAMLGIVKSAKRGTGRFAKASAAAKAGKAGSGAAESSKSDRVRALLATGMSAADIAKKVGCSAPLVYIIKSSMGRAGKRSPAQPRKNATSGSSKSDQVRALLATGMNTADIAKKVGCSANLVYVVKSSRGTAGKRGPGRPRKASTSDMDGLEGIVAAVKNTEREKAQMRAALEKIQAVLADALA